MCFCASGDTVCAPPTTALPTKSPAHTNAAIPPVRALNTTHLFWWWLVVSGWWLLTCLTDPDPLTPNHLPTNYFRLGLYTCVLCPKKTSALSISDSDSVGCGWI